MTTVQQIQGPTISLNQGFQQLLGESADLHEVRDPCEPTAPSVLHKVTSGDELEEEQSSY